MSEYDYDLTVIGAGPAGQAAALQASRLGKQVALLERNPDVGGVTVDISIPSKTLREAVLHLTGYNERKIYGVAESMKQDIKMSDLMVRTHYVMQHQAETLRTRIIRANVDVFKAAASFCDRHTIKLASDEGRSQRKITTDKVCIAVGTSSTKPPMVYADGRLIFVSDDVLNLKKLPRTLAIVGGGPIGLEYCCTFAALGIRVTLINKNSRLLTFADDEIVDTLIYYLRQEGVLLRLGEEVSDIEYLRSELTDGVRIKLASGKQIVSDAVMYCVGRTGNTKSLDLEAVGLQTDARKRLQVDENYQTEVEGVYAVGGVIGFPDLVSTSQIQGRLASRHAFGAPTRNYEGLFPYMVKTIPEIAMVGKTELELTEEEIPYEVGKARYQDAVKNVIKGNNDGLLKLLFSIENRELLGVHIIGDDAAELIHIGQAVIAHGGTVDYFLESVISYPTLAECYVTAALDGVDRLNL